MRGEQQTHASRVRYGAAALLAVHALLLGLSIPRNAVTIDEVVHLPTGMANWQRGEFWGYHHNPPLIRLAFAVPAVLADVPIDYSAYYYHTHPRGVDVELGRDFMFLNRNHYMLVFCMGRAVVAALSVLGGWFVFRWSRALFGNAGGLLSLALWVFCPNVLAHAGLVTPDVGSTVLGFIATYQFWRYLKSPSLGRAIWCGVLLGLTEAAKFSFVLLPLVWGVLAVVALLAGRRERANGRLTALGSLTPGPSPPQGERGDGHVARIFNPCGSVPVLSFRQAGLHAVVVCAISLLVLNDAYLGEGTGRKLGEFDLRSAALTRPLTPDPSPPEGEGRNNVRRENRFVGTRWEQIVVPLPAHYVLGFDDQMYDVDSGMYYKYLRGELRRGPGWWYYYVYAMLVKTPIGALVLIVGGLAAVVLRRCRLHLVTETALLLPPAVFLVSISSQTGLNSHLRYVLPAYPFLFVCAGRLGTLARGTVPFFGTGVDHQAESNTEKGDSPRAGGRPHPRPFSPAGGEGGRFRARHAYAAVILLLVASNVVSVLRVHPHYLAYFNEAAGGPENALAHLADSNIDWGQGLVVLRDWLDENAPGEKIRLAYFGTMYPEVIGIEYELPPFGADAMPAWEDPAQVGPVPGLQAVGANYLVGVPFAAPNAEGRQTAIPLNAYTYFRRFEPVATPGWSIYVYDLNVEEVNRVRREMGLAELDAEARAGAERRKGDEQ